jgi:acetylornithine deacetylase
MASPAPASLKDTVGSLDRDGFVGLLSKLIGETAHLQNDPPTHRPQEERVAQHVVDVLRPVSADTGGGPLLVRKISYVEGRSNVIVEYPGTVPGRVVSFVGMHMDVVPANASEWVGQREFSANPVIFCLAIVVLYPA